MSTKQALNSIRVVEALAIHTLAYDFVSALMVLVRRVSC
jgi:hypothetical protein